MNYNETTADECYGCKSLAKRIEQLERKLMIAKNALEALNYPENPNLLIVEVALEELKNL